MGNQSNAPAYSAAYWPEMSTGEVAVTSTAPALQMDPADVFNYLQQNRQRLGLSNQFEAYNEGDAYVMRMSRADAQHLMDVMAGFANTYMQMAQRNPQLLQAMNGQRMLMAPGSDSGCGCGGGCQCCSGGGNGSWNRGYVSYDSRQQPPQTIIQTPPQEYIYQPNNNSCVYQPNYNGFNGGYNGYGGGFNNYNGYGWNRHHGWGGGNPLMQSLAYGGGNPQQMLRYAGANVVSNLIFRGLSGGGGFGRFRM